MSTIDDIATPMEMMMEENELQKLHQHVATSSPETAPTAEPTSPSSFFMTPVASPMKVHSSDLGHSPLASLVATNTVSPFVAADRSNRMPMFAFSSNTVAPTPGPLSYRNASRRRSTRKPTVPLNISLANRPTKAWLAKQGQLPGQRDAVVDDGSSSMRKRTAGDDMAGGHNKRQKKWHKTVPIETDSTRPTKSWLAKVEASRAIQDRLRQHRQHQPSRMDFSTTACPYFESTQTLQTPNGQFFIYGDHQ
ncbi:unnamed protein product [Cylindrotheca closterium]|uniref:Uncharacterized protein n=1 Tax=Cylindrotheca closterium TaxID=2856 RepID=A0AAD2FW74_9STRA|nr:unnamed protein product [Cylindrotheca closterium]